MHKGWYANGSPAFVYFFKDDKYDGEQISYFESGHIWQCLHYKNGYEEGKQKSFNDSGRIINNFTVKNGKLYGVIGRYDCMSVFNKH
jgi:antitoxin component YwqK of YwqJK toxin-antitoxin module